MRTAQVILTTACLVIYSHAGFLDGSSEPFPVCSAGFNAPCSTTNVVRMVDEVIVALEQSGDGIEEVLEDANAGSFNRQSGFAPFVVNTSSWVILAHGSHTSFVGQPFLQVVENAVLFNQTEAANLVVRAAVEGDGWTKLLWPVVFGDKSSCTSHMVYTRITGDLLVLGMYAARSLSRGAMKFCDQNYDSLCSIPSVRALVGDAMMQLLAAENIADYYTTLRDFSYSSQFKVDGWYLFVYDFIGTNLAHGGNPTLFIGKDTPDVLVSIGRTAEEGVHIHNVLRGEAANGGGWGSYEWRVSLDQDIQTKVSFVQGVNKFGSNMFFGTGITHARHPASLAERCRDCTVSTPLPCSIANVDALVSYTQIELLTDISLQDAMQKISTDARFRMNGGFGVALLDTNGRHIVNTADSSLQNTFVSGPDLTILRNAAEMGGLWVELSQEVTAFAVKVVKNSTELILYSSFSGKRNMTSMVECSARYAHPCAETSVLMLVGLTVQELLLASSQDQVEKVYNDVLTGDLFNRASGDFPVFVVGVDKFIRVEKGSPDASFKPLDSYLQTVFGVTSLSTSFFESLVKQGFQHGGGWIDVPWSTLNGDNVVRKFFVFGTILYTGDQVLVISSFDDVPSPPRCPNCPFGSTCDLSGYCRCGVYKSATFANLEDELTASGCGQAYLQQMQCEPNPEMESVQFVKSIVMSMFAFNTCAAICFGLWTIVFRKHAVVKASQVPFLLLICVGGIVSSSSLVAFTIDDEEGMPAGTGGDNATANFACMASVWLYTIGFVLTFASLFVKLHRVRVLFLGNSLKKSSKTMLRASVTWLMRTVLAVIFVDIVLLIAWSVTSPLRFQRKSLKVASCTSENSLIFIALIGAYHIVLLVYGSYLAYITRGINTLFSEARYISMAMFSSLQIMLLAVPVLILVNDDQASSLFLRSAVVWLNDASVLFMLFAPKVWYMFRGVDTSGIGGDIVSAITSKSKDKNSAVSGTVAPTTKFASSRADSRPN